MKAEIKFDFDIENEQQLFLKMIAAENAFYALCDIYNKIRNSEKYEQPNITLEDFRDIINNNSLDWILIN